MDRLKKINFAVVYLTDVKDEYKSGSAPVQEKFRGGLLPGEIPKGIPMIVLRPTFFQSLQGEERLLPSKNIWYSERFEDLEEVDFKTLLNYEKLTLNQQIDIEDIWEVFKKNPELRLEDVDEIIDGFTHHNDIQRIALKRKFRPIIKAKIFDKKYQLDIIHGIKSGLAVSLNVQGFENFNQGTGGMPAVIVGLLFRKIVNARRAKKISEVFIVIDEMPRFVPKNSNPSCKLKITESYDVDRRFGINIAGCAQSFFDVPEKVIKQSRWIFIPYNVSIDELKEGLKLGGMVKNVQSLNNEAIRLKKQLGKFDWICIDRNSNTLDIFQVLPPLSAHSEVDKS